MDGFGIQRRTVVSYFYCWHHRQVGSPFSKHNNKEEAKRSKNSSKLTDQSTLAGLLESLTDGLRK